MSAVKRAVLACFLQIRKNDLDPPYIRVLAQNKTGTEILKQAKRPQHCLRAQTCQNRTRRSICGRGNTRIQFICALPAADTKKFFRPDEQKRNNNIKYPCYS